MLLKCESGKYLTTTEKIAIDYINENADEILDMSIEEIAGRAFVSAATISRAIKKCGVRKFPDVRHRLAVKEITKKNLIIGEIKEKAYEECTNAIENMDETLVLQIVEHIRDAKRIFILAQGSAQLPALELEAQLRWQGYIATTEWDRNVFMEMGRIAKPGDLLIVYSVACTNECLVEGVRMAKEKGADIVSCVCKAGTPLEKLSDVAIVTGKPSVVFHESGVGSVSFLGLHVITRVLCEFLSVS